MWSRILGADPSISLSPSERQQLFGILIGQVWVFDSSGKLSKGLDDESWTSSDEYEAAVENDWNPNDLFEDQGES